MKQQVDVLFPGWLPASSETQKTFHDHLRTVLEMRGFFELAQLRDFDERFGRALAWPRPRQADPSHARLIRATPD